MTSTTVFNVTDHPVRFSSSGRRVPGRTSTDVVDTADPYYLAALERGDLVVLSATAAPIEVVAVPAPAPDPEPEPEPVVEEPIPDDAAPEEPVVVEPKKKQPTKAKEN